MKIIGRTSDGYIAEISGEELGNLMGFKDNVTRDNGSFTLRAKVGDTVDISTIFNSILNLQLDSDKFAMIAEELEEMSKRLKSISTPKINVPELNPLELIEVGHS